MRSPLHSGAFASTLLLAALTATSGCSETPSYSVRWRVAPRADAETVGDDSRFAGASAVACSRAGVYRVIVQVHDILGRPVDQLDQPCFPEGFDDPDDTIDGGSLPPGEYKVMLYGVRANGSPWGDCVDDNGREVVCDPLEIDDGFCEGGECVNGLTTCDCGKMTVEEDKTVPLTDFTLDAPADCEDGIDGDEDGLVDQSDPGCQAGDREDTPILLPEFVFQPSLFSQNPSADCGDYIGAFEITIDGEVVATYSCSPFGPRRVTTALNAGEHTFGARAIGSQAHNGGEPLTVERVSDFTLSEAGAVGPSNTFEVDFADVDFLEPVVQDARVIINLEKPVDGGGGEDGPDSEFVLCGDGDINTDDYRLTLLDLAGRPVADPPSSDGIPFDGSARACANAQLRLPDLTWGGYQLAFEARDPDGEVCWALESPAILAPDGNVVLNVPLVEDAPASCFN